MPQNPCRYTKKALSIDEQLSLLTSRGLVVNDPDRVCRYLRFIGYFRLSKYFAIFQKSFDPNPQFKPNTTFDGILDVYIFDRKLRLLIMDAIERIEVAVRATISNTMSVHSGGHWYLDRIHFRESYKFNHDKLIDRIKLETGFDNSTRRNESCKLYYETYDDPPLPPSWIVGEVLPIGSWSIIYANLSTKKLQKTISQEFGMQPKIMVSWLHSLTYLRNLCAHHARIWNRKFTITPRIAKKYKELLKDNRYFYAQAVIINMFLTKITKNPHWQLRLLALFKEHPKIKFSLMGFPSDWAINPFWKNTSALT
jgi:abortive infection bacteriophage resistance protein